MGTGVNVRSTADGVEFLHQAKDWLYLNECDNNTLLTIAGQSGSCHSMLRPPFWFALSECPQGLGGAAAFALPDGLVLSNMELTYLPPILTSLLSEGLCPHRIFGPDAVARSAASHLFLQTGKIFSQRTQWISFVATQFVPPADTTLGHLRLATRNDSDLVEHFGNAYAREKPSIVDVARYFLNKIETKELFLWVDNDSEDVKTLVALSGATDNVIRIAGVFTPEKHRCHGYASAAVATVTNCLLEAHFQAVTLVVDRSDPNAMHLYENLGFVPGELNVELVTDVD